MEKTNENQQNEYAHESENVNEVEFDELDELEDDFWEEMEPDKKPNKERLNEELLPKGIGAKIKTVFLKLWEKIKESAKVALTVLVLGKEAIDIQKKEDSEKQKETDDASKKSNSEKGRNSEEKKKQHQKNIEPREQQTEEHTEEKELDVEKKDETRDEEVQQEVKPEQKEEPAKSEEKTEKNEEPVKEVKKEDAFLEVICGSKEVKELFATANLKPLYDPTTQSLLLHPIGEVLTKDSKNYSISAEDIKKADADELAYIIHAYDKTPNNEKASIAESALQAAVIMTKVNKIYALATEQKETPARLTLVQPEKNIKIQMLSQDEDHFKCKVNGKEVKQGMSYYNYSSTESIPINSITKHIGDCNIDFKPAFEASYETAKELIEQYNSSPTRITDGEEIIESMDETQMDGIDELDFDKIEFEQREPYTEEPMER